MKVKFDTNTFIAALAATIAGTVIVKITKVARGKLKERKEKTPVVKAA